jgi:uncharacterized protein
VIRVTLRFHTELSFFLSKEFREKDFETSFFVTRGVKDLIESFGVPHVEVGRILVNGSPAGFEYLVQNGDFVSVLPIPTNQTPAAEPRFIADVHVKTLVRRLRMLGFDTLYDPTLDDHALAKLSGRDSRILLTRDRQLLMRNIVTYGMYVRSTQPDKQVLEVAKRYSLLEKARPFCRCIPCNGKITPIAKDELPPDAVPQAVMERTETFYRCQTCGKYYWRGSHVDKMLSIVSDIRRDLD